MIIKNPTINGTAKVDFTLMTNDAPVLTMAIPSLMRLYMQHVIMNVKAHIPQQT